MKNFLVSFWKRNNKRIDNIKIIRGILFPDSTMAEKKIVKRNKKITTIWIGFDFFKNIGITKNENKENLCIKLPAINSSPNGPDNFLPIDLKPKISSPKISW